ncbi:MAG: hypothetical protein V1929_13440 [bacterium]
MRKFVAVALVLVFLVAPVASLAAERNTGAATVLSLVMPGTGEWYNNGWQGSFPWAECVIGHICFCFTLSSAIDAANGNTDIGLRPDFWTAPSK